MYEFVSRVNVRIYGRASKCNLLISSPFFKDCDVWFIFMCIHLYYFSIILLLQFVRFIIHFLKDVISPILIEGTICLFTKSSNVFIYST
jgi:hypothetical protein